MEDSNDSFAPGFCEAEAQSWEDQSWEVDGDLGEIEDPEMLEALENPIPIVVSDVVPNNGQESDGPSEPDLPTTSTNNRTTKISVDIPSSTLIAPRYHYRGEDLPAPPERELNAIQRLLEEHQHLSDLDDDFIEFELDQFAIYSLPNTGPRLQTGPELRPLQHLAIKQRCGTLFVDGVLSVGETRFFVQRVPFAELPIGNYGVAEPTVGADIWIRSKTNAAKRGDGVYYRLKTPSQEYRRFHMGFLWIADLAKHVVDYLSNAIKQKRRVVFRDFRSNFSEWLSEVHQSQPAFDRWRKQYSSSDFCVAIVANLDFIYKEACGGPLGDNAGSLHLWREIRDFTAYSDDIKKMPLASASPTSPPSPGSPSPGPNKSDQIIPKTIVTPYIDQLFNHLPCGMMLEALSPSPETQKLRRDIINTHKLESSPNIHIPAKQIDSRKPREVRVGDVISTPRDEDDTNWAREAATGFDNIDRWFGLVQEIHKLREGKRSFDVIWIYRPVDTLCGTMKYPWNNELFLSDHCSCQDKEHSKIKEDEILSVHSIDWGGSSQTNFEFFCRQTYLHGDRQWVTFQESHLRCCHHRDDTDEFPYKIGDTVLVCLKSNEFAEPCELMALPDENEDVILRLLHRRQRLEPDTQTAANELVYSDEMQTLKTKRIHGKCIVRFFKPHEPIPPPYDRNGVGNAFFITHYLRSGQIVPINDGFTSLRQGFNPSKGFTKLHGVDLFCGGGNFGRGLEEGGAIEMKWANDINISAIHTYMANATNKVHPFAGSIDDMQRQALEGKFSDRVPPIGSVDFVSGGSPCPGFSRLTIDKTTPEQRKNQSLIAAFASFIDTYRPKFGLLENVVGIVQPQGKRNEDVFCQLICAIVGLGYQTHFFLLDAWTYGSPQSRSRVFLCFAAPGLKLPDMPLHSHSHYDTSRTKTLGWLPNGEPMVTRLVMPTPFKFVTAAEATADLPDIMDGKADYCVNFPDHRLVSSITRNVRAQLNSIPFHPFGKNFRTTWDNGRGIMTKAERTFFPKKGEKVESSVSHAWERVFPNKVMNTITTTPAYTDARCGRLLHWNQNRFLSVMEVRRAQGFRDHEVILGQPRDQWKVVGNSVAREVSLALGLSIREAWLGSLVDGDEIEPKTHTPGKPMAYDDSHESSLEILQLHTLPLGGSRMSTPGSETSQPPKRPLPSSLAVEQFVSKLPRTNNVQSATEQRELITSDLPSHGPANASSASSTNGLA